MAASLTGAALGLGSTACSGALADGDGRAFGDDLGRFQVTADQESSTCGADALDAPAHWEFEVVLSHDRQHFYWNTGADAVRGELSDDGTRFRLTSKTVLSEEGDACAIERTDHAEGVLDDAERARNVRGLLSYAFSQPGGAECEGLGLPPGVTLAKVPCSMSYRMTAEWISER